MFGSAFGGLYYNLDDHPKDLIIEMLCTLEEIYSGGIKKVYYTKRVVNNDGRTTEEKEYSKDIEIIKGINNETRKVFIGEGNEKPGYSNCKQIRYIILSIFTLLL